MHLPLTLFALVTTFFVHSIRAQRGRFESAISKCPLPCSPDLRSSTWTYHHNLGAIATCEATVIIETNIRNALDDPKTQFLFRACAASVSSTPEPDTVGRVAKRQTLAMNSTKPHRQEGLSIVSWGRDSPASSSSAQSAIKNLASFMAVYGGSGGSANLFAKSGDVVAGIYVGSQVLSSSASEVAKQFASSEFLAGSRVAVQGCGTGNETISPEFFGIAVDNTGDFAAVQELLVRWNNAECISDADSERVWQGVALDLVPGSDVDITPQIKSVSSFDTRSVFIGPRQDGTCEYIQVQPGDGCWSLGQRCSITQSELESYNGGSSFCGTLQPEQYVCCSPGSLPDFSPQPNGDGSCFAYEVRPDDSCYTIAEAHQTTIEAIENSNPDTWGWTGCGNLLLGMNICLSSGRPPFPTNIPNAVCGPQSNDTEKPENPSTWAALNGCPLSACCNIWGQCGITEDFCIANPADTGNPGTAQPGSNGCISNCGTDIVQSNGPAEFRRIGYWSAFNLDRPCNTMSIDAIPSFYTHVHFAFGNLTDTFQVDVSGYPESWEKFLRASTYRRIISFGGWAFSTEPATYNVFRSGVAPENRQAFANSIAKFVVDNELDGVDFDWEYPGAPDDQGTGIPPGDAEDGENYLEFLKLVRAAIPSQYELGICAPASYWYLKAFPIGEIAKVVDYIVYMTYDLHGQWDYGNTFTSPGCPNGNCLRSHVNNTETESAFSMITKAGVPSNKIVVGQPLYGRSFQMTDPGCYTEQCTFTGPESGATPGECTGTGGYLSNIEIRDILNGGANFQEYYDNVAGDILVYNGDQWVSYMKPSTYAARGEWARSLGMGGLVDWAIDLNTTAADNDEPGDEEGTGGSGVVYVGSEVYEDEQNTVWCEPPCTFVFPPMVLPEPTTISRDPITETVLERWPSVSTNPSGVTSTLYVSRTTVTTISLPPVTTTELPVWNVVYRDNDEEGEDDDGVDFIWLTNSVRWPGVTLTQQDTTITTSQTSTTLPGITYVYSAGPWPEVTPPPPGPPPPPPPPPPPIFPPSIVVSVGPPRPTCVIRPCGNLCDSNCDLELPCFGICDCIGLGCPGGGCVGPGCSGSDGNDPENPEQTQTCEPDDISTVSSCRVACSITPDGGTFTTSCYTTSCASRVGCDVEGTTVTSNTRVGCPTPPPVSEWASNPDQDIPTGGVEATGTWTQPTGPFTPVDPSDDPLPGDNPNEDPDEPEEPGEEPEEPGEEPEEPGEEPEEPGEEPEEPGEEPEEPPPPPPPEPSQRLWVFYLHYIDQILNQYEWWFVHRPLDGSSWSICEEENDRRCGNDEYDCNLVGEEGDLENPPWPDGEYPMTRGDAEGCTYRSDGNGPGTLSCPGRDDIECQGAGFTNPEAIECPVLVSGYDFYAAVVCDYA